MNKILEGIIKSEQPQAVKEQLLARIAAQGSKGQSPEVVTAVLNLAASWVHEEPSVIQSTYGLKIYTAWGKQHVELFHQFFNQDYAADLFSSNCSNGKSGSDILLILESLKVLQQNVSLSPYSELIRVHIVTYVKERPFIDCLKCVSDLMLEFKDCIPSRDGASQFCINLVQSLSTCLPPENEAKVVSFIYSVNKVATLLAHIWSSTGNETVIASLKTIFTIVSQEHDIEPSLCLGALVPLLPANTVKDVARYMMVDVNIDDNRLVLALERIIHWLMWPTARRMDVLILELMRGLAVYQKYDVLRKVTEDKTFQIFQKLQFSPVREACFNISSHMLLSYQYSPDIFHRILSAVPKIVSLWEGESSGATMKLLHELANLLYTLMYLHTGYPELYDPVCSLLQKYPKPSVDMMKARLAECKWTNDVGGVGRVSQSVLMKTEMGKTGLFNLGNTCYINSILQALYMCDSFQQDVLQHIPSVDQGLIVKLQYVFAFLRLSQRPSYAPVKFIAASRPTWFSAGAQQDCSEFLKYLLDQLHEQELTYRKKAALDGQPHDQKKAVLVGHPTDDKEAISDSQPSHQKKQCTESDNINTNGYSEGEDAQQTPLATSLVRGHFGGRVKMTVTCLNCRTQSERVESCIDLGLAFPENWSRKAEDKTETNASPKSTKSASNSTGRTLHLNDLIQHYFSTEKLTGDNKYHCDQCSSLQDADRDIEMVETPEYLILTLLRFSYDLKTHSRSKICREVRYPKTLLLPSSYGRKPSENAIDPSNSCNINGNGQNSDASVYALCSVVVHSGMSSDCGHYYCYARHASLAPDNDVETPIHVTPSLVTDDLDLLEDKWYQFNDSRVSYTNYESFCNVSQRFSTDTPYVLFYKKVSTTSSSTNGNEHSLNGTADVEVQKPALSPVKALRSDLRSAVTEDNRRFLEEQEQLGRKRSQAKPVAASNWYRWGDNDDDSSGGGGIGPCGGGGGGGSLDTTGSRFVF